MADQQQETKTIQVKQPRRVLHCSDGVYEEYSSDEEEEPANPQDMSLIRRIGHNIVYAMDYAGEAIASFFNITTPKYNYEIQQFKKMEEERQREEQERIDNTWQVNDQPTTTVTEAPSQKF